MVARLDLEWEEAQRTVLSLDLVSAAKLQLKFLAAVDRNPSLYEGAVLRKAIYRYTTCWLPLLEKHCGHPITEGSLVVPFDCEWVWHCHRLNPVQYKLDCEKLYGRSLGNLNVISSVIGIPVEESENIWKSLYPEEPFQLELNNVTNNRFDSLCNTEDFLNYDLLAAVKRQAPFFNQVSRSHMSDDLYLVGAVERYKGFLHLIKMNRAKGLKQFCVPTYDIDLIWHSHQLHPGSYCQDMTAIFGNVLEHDDTDPDRSKGKKLDVGFRETKRQWEETFGLRYMRAGAMYSRPVPSPIKSPKLQHDFTGNLEVNEDHFGCGDGWVTGWENAAVHGGCGGSCGNFVGVGGCGGACGGGCGGGCGGK